MFKDHLIKWTCKHINILAAMNEYLVEFIHIVVDKLTMVTASHITVSLYTCRLTAPCLSCIV